MAKRPRVGAEQAVSLKCLECGAVSDDSARGWRAYLSRFDDKPVEVCVYCPACAEREFGSD
jgi:hypothetical protein